MGQTDILRTLFQSGTWMTNPVLAKQLGINPACTSPQLKSLAGTDAVEEEIETFIGSMGNRLSRPIYRITARGRKIVNGWDGGDE